MLDQPIVGVDGTFYFGDGKEIRFLILPDGTVRQASDEDDVTGVERRRLLATGQLLHGLRDALLDSGLGEVESGPVEVAPVPESADDLAWHLLHDHGLSADRILNWLLIRSEREHTSGRVFYSDNIVGVILEELHHCDHEYTGREFNHTHESDCS